MLYAISFHYTTKSMHRKRKRTTCAKTIRRLPQEHKYIDFTLLWDVIQWIWVFWEAIQNLYTKIIEEGELEQYINLLDIAQ